jgi:hypothetical protein
VENEWAQGWSIFDDDGGEPYPFGIPERVHAEQAKFLTKYTDTTAAKRIDAFNTGNAPLPDGTVVRTKADDMRDAHAAIAGAAIGKIANTRGRFDGTPGLMMPAGVGVQTVAVNLRITRTQAEELQGILARDPEAMDRLIDCLQREAVAQLVRLFGIDAAPLRPPGEFKDPFSEPVPEAQREPAFEFAKEGKPLGLAALLQSPPLREKYAALGQATMAVEQSKRATAALFKA